MNKISIFSYTSNNKLEKIFGEPICLKEQKYIWFIHIKNSIEKFKKYFSKLEMQTIILLTNYKPNL